MTDTLNPADDYAVVKRAIALISEQWREQPSLEALADELGLSPFQLQKLFTRWAGLSPKGFLQAVTLNHAKGLLARDASLMEASLELGLSGPSRLHDLFITHEGVSPGIYKARGKGLAIHYGFHPSPFGRALVMLNEGRLSGLAFVDEEGDAACLADMTRRWPEAHYVQDQVATAPFIARIFAQRNWRAEEPLRIVLIGTDFEIRVWEQLLTVPMGRATSYSEIAGRLGKPSASRAVGAAVGRNPISFVVPCHRVLATSGALCGYHWGLTRKRAMLGWEAGQTSAVQDV